MRPDHAAIARLLGPARDAIAATVGHDTSALQLFRDARDVAETRLPGPLGVAVAAVLAMAAHERDVSGISGSLGASVVTMALARAVLDLPELPALGTMPPDPQPPAMTLGYTWHDDGIHLDCPRCGADLVLGHNVALADAQRAEREHIARCHP